MGNILIVKGADFSSVAVEQVTIVDNPYYEQASKLIGDGTAAINTLYHQTSSNLEIEATINLKTVNGDYYQNIISNYTDNDSPSTRIYVAHEARGFYGTDKETNTKGFEAFTGITTGVHSFILNKDGFKIDGNTIAMTRNYISSGYVYAETPFGLFSRVGGAVVSNCELVGHVYFKESGVSVRDFIPCKLLRTVTGEIASDNLTHNIGECGLWDLVDNKFYGNCNQSGTFTVA